MEITLFFTGVFVHLSFELLGINRWYCKNSYACEEEELLKIAKSIGLKGAEK